MKFRIRYPPIPAVMPPRVVTDYSPAEQVRCREAFRPLAERYRWYERTACIVAVVGFGCGVLIAAFGQVLNGWIVVGWLTCWLVPLIFLIARTSLPCCPACHNKLDGNSGAYCPECGARALQPGGLFHAPWCSACGRALQWGKTRGYKIRACTYCGVMLDAPGL